jgi:hypothetical protein
MTSSIDPNQLSTDTATSGAQGSGATSLVEHMHAEEPTDVYERAGYWRANAKYFAAELDKATATRPAMYEALKDLLSAVEAQAQHAARVNTHSDAHLWEPSELLMKPARAALAAVDGRA